jgi:hypothetical protein
MVDTPHTKTGWRAAKQALRLFMLAALAILAGVWLLFPPAPSQPATAAPVAGDAPAAPSSPSTATAVDLPPLPPHDARVQDVLPTLQARADAGDGIAACRLSIELMRCQISGRELPDKQAYLERQLTRHLAKQEVRAVAAVEEKLSALRAEQAACARFPDGLANRAMHYLRAAALAGEPMSRLRYASGEGFRATGDHDYLRTPAFDVWRREAEALMQQSLEEGSPEAALVLAFAYGSDDGLFLGLVANDDARAVAQVQLLRLVFGESSSEFPLPLPQPRVPQAEASRAEALALEWHQRHFGGRQYNLGALMRNNAFEPWQEPRSAQNGRDPCPGPGAHVHD